MVGMPSTQIARIAYDACNSLSQVMGHAASPEYSRLSGDRQNRMLEMVNSINAGKPYAFSPGDDPLLPQVQDHALTHLFYKLTLAITRVLSRPE